jgi:A/G-specific adenine glycosylase
VWLWLRCGDRLWLQQRPPQGVWAGLWSLPEFASFDALAEATRGWSGEGEALPSFTHVLTHFDWRLHPRRWTLPHDLAPAPALPQDGRWFTHEQALALGLPAPLRKLLAAA